MKYFLITVTLLWVTGCSTFQLGQSEKSGEPSNSLNIGVQLADDLIEAGNYTAAVGILDNLASKRPKDTRITERMAKVYYLAGDYDTAQELYETWGGSRVWKCPRLKGYGFLMLRRQQALLSKRSFEQCLQQEPTDKEAQQGLVIAASLVQSQTLNASGLPSVPNSNAVSAKQLNNIGLAMLLSGKNEQAIRYLEKVAFTPNSTVQVRQNLALAYGLKGDTYAARQIGRLDLPAEQVETNLKIYAELRRQPDRSALRTLLLGP